MKLGCCAPLKDAERLKAIGFEYVECSAAELVVTNDLSAKYVNQFLPSGLSIFSDADQKKLRSHAVSVISSAKQKGIRIITFGSGGARMIDSDCLSATHELLWRNFLLFLDYEASENGVTIALEPLVKQETNFINKIHEAVRWINILGLKSFGVTIDSYHLQEEKKPMLAIEKYHSKIVHSHLSSNERTVPVSLAPELKVYIQHVKALGCDMTLEIVPYNFDEIPKNFIKMIKGEIE